MPLRFGPFGHLDKKAEPESFISPSTSLDNRRPSASSPHVDVDANVDLRPPQRTTTSNSGHSSVSSQPSGILRRPDRHDSVAGSSSTASGSQYTTQSSSSGASSNTAYVTKRLSNMNFGRSETIDSVFSDDERGSGGGGLSSTPGTSVSSFGAQCPLPASSSGQRFPYFMMTLSSVSTLSFIALPVVMRPIVLDAIGRAWKKGIQKTAQVEYLPELMNAHKAKGCDGGVWEVTMKDNCWMPESKDKVSSKRILINLMTEFAREGYNLNSSFKTTAKTSGKDTLIFMLEEPDPDTIFFAVAFHSSDRVWIIDAEADIGQHLEEGIRNWWMEGIRDARVRERHCREIRLRGSPWTAHNTSALISARCIHLVIMKSITHQGQGYEFVGSVDMADSEEGEMPVTFYRKRGISP